uniref:PH domain-containing protein n=1 Tax=Oryza brachyantha TaxID=4533 RepID=J3N503_ORYBR
MLEDQVAFLLQKYLGNYVRGLSKEALKISVWRGDVELTNMQLKPEALNSLKLPVRVKAGFLGSVKLKVPWSRLGQEPVLVYLDRIFILAEPATQVEGCSEDAVQEAKRSRVREMEIKLLESQQQMKSELNSSWLGSFISTVIGNIKLFIGNIHIRYEDTESNPGHPFAAGLVLSKLSAVTVDDLGKETFATGGDLDRVKKSVELEGLALYFDSDSSPWSIHKSWEDLLPSEWSQIFEFRKQDSSSPPSKTHTYILRPISGKAKYTKVQLDAAKKTGQALQNAVVDLDDVTLSLSKDGYRDVLKMADNFSSFNQRLKYAHYRPSLPVKSDPRSWWKYAYKVVINETKKASGNLSWEQLLKYARLRKKYVSSYASLLKSDMSRLVVDDGEEIKRLDRELDMEVILQWRMLAHKFVEQSAEKHQYAQQNKQSWWSFGWTGSSKDEGDSKSFSDEDWERLNRIIGYKENTDYIPAQQDMKLMQFYFEIRMKHNASKLIIDSSECLADLSCENFCCNLKMYPEAKIFDLKLGSYKLLSPYGLLAESASDADSLVGFFSYKPFDEQLDWSFTAKASPCYITYLKDSIDQIIEFFKSSPTISQTLAIETAAAVQMTLDEVKRTAQQQMTRVLKDQSRFSLNLDIAAPKITVPTKFCPDDLHETKLLLDLGNLILRTEEIWDSCASEEQDLYLNFNLVLSDVSAFLVDGDYHWNETLPEVNLMPVIDKCGIALKLQQIQLESPLYPSTRMAVRVPSLGFHFSPARYHRLMQILKIFQDNDSEKNSSDLAHLWDQADFEGWSSLLTWKGVGNREATWQRRYLRLVGPFLLRNKQVHQILEDTGALILLFDNEETRKTWQSRLQGAIYRASGSAAISSFPEVSLPSEVHSFKGNFPDVVNIEKLFVAGILDELKICFSCGYESNHKLKKVLLAKESSLFEFRAVGGQVELSMKGGNLLIGTILRSLEIEDQYYYPGSPVPRYLARSFINSTQTKEVPTPSQKNSAGPKGTSLKKSESEERFFEASDDFDEFETPMLHERSISDYFSTQNFLPTNLPSLQPPAFSRIPGLMPDSELQSAGFTSGGITFDSFVKAQMVIYDQQSPQYNNLDNRVVLTVATLTFFCHRPTVIAIMEFMNAINLANVPDANKNKDTTLNPIEDNIVEEPKSDLEPEPVIKRLLAKGKSRTVFHLTSSMAEAQILLMNEKGDRLATLSQNNLSTDIKVFTSSFSIKAALGNLKISDDSLRSNHPYFWVCDMRNPGGSSFVEIDFSSYNVDDEDYSGYDYSLSAQLSEVRIVYLNRFVQEIISYFMGLVPKSSDGVVKLKDDVTNSEKWVSKTDMEGSPALKLDVSFSRPIIVMPRETKSKDFLELDVLYIKIQNEFQWIGGNKNEMSAVHLEILTVTVKDINLTIGMNMVCGETIIQDVEGLSFEIHRSLRDLMHQLPVVEAAIKVDVLKAALSNREYEIISECALSNFSETPQVVPALDDPRYGPSTAESHVSSSSVSSESIQDLSQDAETWITNKLSVSINLVELSLHSGSTRDSPIASVQASGAWLLYKSNTREESFLFATLKGFSVFDDREGTKDELRLAIGKSATVRDTSSADGYNNANELDSGERRIQKDLGLEPIPSMLILDAILRKSSSTVSLCVQRPKFLVALDFLLAIVEFFVPSARSLLSNDEDKDLLHMTSPLVFSDQVYYQECSTLSLSSQKPLIVDSEKFDHYVYDGKGGKLYLRDGEGKILSGPSSEKFIHVLCGKGLQFRNVTIVNGEYLDSCIYLGSDCWYSASENDHVYLARENDGLLSTTSEEIKEDVVKNTSVNRSTEFIIEVQAIGPELTFYSTSRSAGENLALSTKVIHARTDAFCRLIMKGDSMEMSGNILGLKMESNGIRVIEPFDMSMKYSNASGKTNLHLLVSEIYMNFSFSILRLFLAVEEEISAFLRMSSKKMSLVCSQFDKVATTQGNASDQVYSFWRPRAPSGYAIFGDFLTPMNGSPTKGVLALNTNIVRVKRPLSYKLVWRSGSPRTNELQHSEKDVKSTPPNVDQFCSIWLPIAPVGYVAMGCVASIGTTEPPLSSVFCLSASLVSSCGLRDCIPLRGNANMTFWRVDNAFGSFLPGDPVHMCMDGNAYDLRHMLFNNADSSKTSSIGQHSHNDASQIQRSALNSGRLFETVASFKLIWSNNGSSSPKKLSIWRPMLSEGMFCFGDIAVNGYEPPNSAVVLRNFGDDTFLRAPEGYQLVGRIKKHRGTEGVSFWFPQAPPGFVALGCVASKSSSMKEDLYFLRCIRSDMVKGGQFSEESVWDSSGARTSERFSLWTVDNDAGTFLVRSGFRRPPRRLALKLAGPPTSSSSDSIIIDAEIKSFSAVSFDDYGGMMVPLFGMSFDSVGFSYHGGPQHLNATVGLSFVARSYNDKYSSWEPFIEPTDGFLRYQYDMNTPGSPGQLRIASTRDLNLNISVSNINMLSQAYASWNNISLGNELYRKDTSSTSEKSILDVHERRSYYVIPQNKLGLDVYIRTTEYRSSDVTRLSSGDDKSIKVPASRDLLDSHLKGRSVRLYRLMVTAILADAEIKVGEGLATGEYLAAVRIYSEDRIVSGVQQQSARTCAAAGEQSSQSIKKVEWNEMFFFKIESEDNYILEFVVLDAGGGQPVGIYSTPLKQVVQKLPSTSSSNCPKFDLTLGDLSSTKTVEHESVKSSGKIRFAVLISGRANAPRGSRASQATSKAGYIQISPSKEGPWTNMKLNYAVPAACWRFGNCVIASEATVKEGNRYVSIRSLVSVTNTTDFIIDLRLKGQYSRSSQSDGHGESSTNDDQISIGLLEPGSTVPIPLSGISNPVVLYMLQLRPANHHELVQYSWSDVQEKHSQTEYRNEEILDICVSDLYESENLLFCAQTDGTSSAFQGLWFCLSIEAKEIGKDVHTDPIYDWSIIIKSPLSLAYYLPISAHYILSVSHLDEEDSSCSQGTLNPGEVVKAQNVDPRNPLYLSLVPHGGWTSTHEPVPISHPTEVPSKFINLRSSLSGRIVQIVLEQSSDKDNLMAKSIRIYVPYWISFARLPPINLQFIDISGRKDKRRILARPRSERNEKIMYELQHEELVEGYTIASGLNFKGLGLSASACRHGSGQFGLLKELSPLSDMDGAVDLSAYDGDGNCTHILLCSKPSSYQAVPTKVIYVRPYITFTNRVGQDLYIKLSIGDEPKVLYAHDWRVSFMYSEGETEKLQVRLVDTDWCQPLDIVKEDTIVIAMRKQDGTQKFIKAEIRGYEEGSRFLIVFRLGPSDGPIRIENRTNNTAIGIRQSGLREDSWIQVKPLSTRKYSWDDPYGHTTFDVNIQQGDVTLFQCVDLENPDESSTGFREHHLKLSIVETADVKILKFVDYPRRQEGEYRSDLGDQQASPVMQNETDTGAALLELIVELGVVGASLIDHKPRELLYLHLQKVFISYMTGYDSGTTSRFKLIIGHMQLDNQLPLSIMPVAFATESIPDPNHPVFKANIAVSNVTSNGIQVYPHVYIRVTDQTWRLNIHEPIIWALVDFYSNLRFVSTNSSSTVTEVDPEIRIELVDISEIRLKISLETAPTQRPRGVLGIWSPVLSAVGNALKIQVHLRKVMHKRRYMRKSSIIPAITNRIKRDLIHNPLHLIFSVDFFGVTKSTLSSLSKGFAELSTDGQFLQLRSKQVWSRRITGVGDGLVQGTEAFAQGLAFGVSGVLRKPVESARQYGAIGVAHGLGRAFVGFIVQPLSGAFDFFSLTVDGISASFMRCVDILNNKHVPQRIRDPRAIHRDGIIREYDKVQAAGQMALYLAEASRYFACTDLFREPSKYAWSDYYEDHFIVQNQRVALVTNKRVILLQCVDLDKMDKKPSKILWDVPWEEVLTLELAKAGYQRPSHVIIHLKNFRRSENFVRLIKCNVDEEHEPQALLLCSSIRKMWRSHQADMKVVRLKVPSGQREVYFASDEDMRESHSFARPLLSPRGAVSNVEERLISDTVNFQKIWSSEQEIRSRCKLLSKQVADDGRVFSIWRPQCPTGYVSIGDVAHVGTHPPHVAALYKNVGGNFALPLGYDLVWRNCAEDYRSPVSIWLPRPPERYVALGCVAVNAFDEPALDHAFCVSERFAEDSVFEEQIVWASSDAYPWGCYVYQVQSRSLQFMALRRPKEDCELKPKKVSESYAQQALERL